MRLEVWTFSVTFCCDSGCGLSLQKVKPVAGKEREIGEIGEKKENLSVSCS